MHDATPWDHLLALLVGLVLPLAAARRQGGEEDEPEAFTTRDKLALYLANSLVLAILGSVTLLVWTGGGRSLAELGLTAPSRAPGAGLALTLVFLALYGVDTLVQLRPRRLPATRERWRRQTPFMPATRREVGYSLVLITSASVWEEIVFRGFLVSYATTLAGTTATGLTVAVALPAAVFGLCHLYQGVHAAAKIALLASCFGTLLVVTGSLWIPIVLHFVVDLIGSLLGPRLLADPPRGGIGRQRAP